MSSAFTLERAAAGDTSPPAGSDDAVAALRADDARILEALPPRVVAAEVARRRAARRSASRTTRAIAGGGALAAVCALALVVVVGADAERAKGDPAPSLVVWRRAGDDAEQLPDRARVAPGDVIQLAYRSGHYRHGVIVAIDGAGHASLVFPDPIGADTSLKAGGAPLPVALEIDDAAGFERFVLVGASDPLDAAAVLDAARSLARDPRRARTAALPIAHAAQTSIVLEKETPCCFR